MASPNADDVTQLVQSARGLRARLLADPHRPGYHITTPEGLCAPFDPNGALFWKGRYHLMYIIQTGKGHCWAHISSNDLVHWRHHPLALEPGGADAGIFSGGAFIDKNGVPTITYWGLGNPCGICLATSTDDDLDHWVKSPHNPVIRETAPGLTVQPDGTVYGAADPSAIWTHNGRYYLLTGNLLVLREFGLKQKMPEHQGDTLYLFVSDDLAKWTYLHPFYKSDRKWTRADEDNMCPDFFPLGDRHMILFISHNLGCQYYIGRYENDRFTPETHGRMTWADNAFFAPESLVDGKGRRIMWAWVFDGRKGETRAASGWSGTMSLPRVLSLGEDKTLRMAPPEELALLRYNPRKHENLSIAADGELPLKDVSGNSLELSIEMVPDGAAQCGVKVCCSPDGKERTLVFYDAAAGLESTPSGVSGAPAAGPLRPEGRDSQRAESKLKIDTTHSSLGEGPKSVEGGPFELKPGEPLKLRVFVDKSVVEVFANDRQAVMRCIYPTLGDSLGVALFSKGGPARVPALHAWDMMPSNPY